MLWVWLYYTGFFNPSPRAGEIDHDRTHRRAGSRVDRVRGSFLQRGHELLHGCTVGPWYNTVMQRNSTRALSGAGHSLLPMAHTSLLPMLHTSCRPASYPPYTAILGVGSGVAISALLLCLHPAAAQSFGIPSRAAALTAVTESNTDSFIELELELVCNAAWCLSAAVGFFVALQGASTCGRAIPRCSRRLQTWINRGLSLPLMSIPLLACMACYHFSWSCQGIDQRFEKVSPLHVMSWW